MRAAYFSEHGNLEQIKIGEVTIPKIGPNDVLIETKYFRSKLM